MTLSPAWRDALVGAQQRANREQRTMYIWHSYEYGVTGDGELHEWLFIRPIGEPGPKEGRIVRIINPEKPQEATIE